MVGVYLVGAYLGGYGLIKSGTGAARVRKGLLSTSTTAAMSASLIFYRPKGRKGCGALLMPAQRRDPHVHG